MTATLPACSVHDLTEVAQEDSGEVEGDSAQPPEPSAEPADKSDGPSDDALVVENVLEEVSKSRLADRSDVDGGGTGPHTSRSDPAGDSARVFVPGYGWVAWSDPLLDAQARYLSLIHRPAPQQVRYRLRWRVVPQRVAETERCRFCGQEWQCAEAAWAASRLAHSARQRGGGGRRIAGKHRARLIDRLTHRRSGAAATPARRLDPIPEI
ncbi:hypothetical protein GCM10027569_49740 [Flindersiella endophytica]